jgi:cell division protein FtsB
MLIQYAFLLLIFFIIGIVITRAIFSIGKIVRLLEDIKKNTSKLNEIKDKTTELK